MPAANPCPYDAIVTIRFANCARALSTHLSLPAGALRYPKLNLGRRLEPPASGGPPFAGTAELVISYSHDRAGGLAYRDKLRSLILPKLRPGSRIPSAGWLGRFLSICPAEARRHMRRTLNEAQVVTETRGVGRARRVYVVSISAALLRPQATAAPSPLP